MKPREQRPPKEEFALADGSGGQDVHDSSEGVATRSRKLRDRISAAHTGSGDSKRVVGMGHKLSKSVPKAMLPSSRLFMLKVLEPSQTEPPARD